MQQQVAQACLEFLRRVDLKPSEIPAFQQVWQSVSIDAGLQKATAAVGSGEGRGGEGQGENQAPREPDTEFK